MEIEKEIDIMLDNNIVKIDDNKEDSLGKDLQEISKELVKDKNVFRFGNTSRQTIGYDSLLGAIGDRPFYNKDIKPRYAFIQSFRYNYTINRGALKSGMADRFKDLAGSLLGFKAMLEYRSAGIAQGGMEEEKKHSLLDKIRKS